MRYLILSTIYKEKDDVGATFREGAPFLYRRNAYILYLYIGRNTIFRTMIISQKFFEKFVKKYLHSL